MLEKTNDLNAPTLRPFAGGLRNYSLCRYFDRQQRMLRRVNHVCTRNLPLNIADVQIRKCRQLSTKDLNHGTENRSRDYLSSVSLWKMGASMHPSP